MQLSFLTLNCWGVNTPMACQLRKERMEAIATELCRGEHDVVALQEIWSQDDGKFLEERVCKTLPYSHRYYSQIIGTGLCIFSKYPILDTFYHRFHLNGYAHNVHHGDWFGGKGVAMARIDLNGFRMNVYVTHMCAQYHEPNDEYHGHRVCQAFELAQFIRTTSEACDAVIVAGDFNTRPESVAYRMITTHGLLKDAWVDQKVKPSEEGHTSNLPSNPFHLKDWLTHFPSGERLDYIMYRNNQGCTLECDHCCVTMGQVPGESYSYSDHEGLCAKFYMRRNPTALPPEIEYHRKEQALNDAVQAIETAAKKITPDVIFFSTASILILLVIVILSVDGLTIPYVSALWKFLLTLAFGYTLNNAIVSKRCERNGLRDILGHVLQVQKAHVKIK